METYSKHLGLFRNAAVTAEIESLDPVKDHCRMVHLLTGYEFPWDMVRALEVALMRTFCSPAVSQLLHRTGEFRKYGQQRYDDTALLVATFMQNGYHDGAGSMAIEHTNKIHGLYRIENEEFLFVLSTFIFEPIKWIDAHGWRKTTSKERLALFYFFREVGVRMNIHDIPESIEELQEFVNDYEARNFIYRETNRKVADATIRIVQGWLPFFVKPFVLPVMKCLLDTPMLKALGYTQPSPLLKYPVKKAMRLRAWFLRKITFKKYPSFVTTEDNRTYPDGYKIEHLGPGNLVKKLVN
jgi:hypothetical protein